MILLQPLIYQQHITNNLFSLIIQISSYLQANINSYKMKALISVSVILLLTMQVCLGWWDVGHMLTAAIAQKHLNKVHPYASVHIRQLTQSINFLVDNKSHTFIESACWPDDIKSSKYSMNLWNAWHYTDRTYVVDGVFPIINFTQAAINSINIVNHAVKVIGSNIKNLTAQRALFARYLVHVVGDMHQPLHSVALFNETFPSGDRGGNSLKVIISNGTSQNLHSFWDAGGLLVQNDSWTLPRPLSNQNLTKLLEVASDYMQDYGPKLEALSKQLNPVKWAIQSYQLAKNTTYPDLEKSNVLSQNYINKAYELSKERITLGGYRLANLIIEIYENSTKVLQQASKWEKQRIQMIKIR